MDLILYYEQRATGVAEGEEKITLKALADKYKISVTSLQGYEKHTIKLLQVVRRASQTVGVSYLDVIVKTTKYYNHVEELYEECKKKGSLAERAAILEKLYPIALDRLQKLLPREDSDGIGPSPVQTGQVGSAPVPVSISLLNAIGSGQQQAEQKAVTIRREDGE